MNLIADIIIRHRKTVLLVFLLATVVCAMLYPSVTVKYDMVEYLPKDAQSTVALKLMREEFTQALPNAKVTVWDVSLMEALNLKRELAGLEHVEEALWLDDVVPLLHPAKTAISRIAASNTDRTFFTISLL